MTGAGLVALVAAVAVALVAVGAVVSRRSVRHRIDAAATRLGAGRADDVGRGLEGALTRLERAVEGAVLVGEESQAAAARFAGALEVIPQGVVVWDEQGRELHRNEAASTFVGARHGEALVEQAIEEQMRAALQGVSQRRNVDLFGPPRRMLVLSAVPLDDGHRTTGALAVIEDVSERRRLEAVRRDFVANISHELKTPVGALAVLAEAIESEDDMAVVRRLSRRMTGEAQRVARIIDDLLDLSRIEAQETPQREPVPVHLVVAEAMERVRALADAHGVPIAVADVPPGRTIRGDRRQLVSAVANLLENACKYSDEGSPVEVTTRSEAGWIELEVRDRGIGIPARDLDRVFERFYRVDRARSRATGGTGLGLAIVRHVATNHRGEVRVESREGEGSVFTLRLPSGPGPVSVSDAGAERRA